MHCSALLCWAGHALSLEYSQTKLYVRSSRLRAQVKKLRYRHVCRLLAVCSVIEVTLRPVYRISVTWIVHIVY